ncbi:MAG TPA: MarR family transcriptional regulator [Jatrophihabitantaceae bacterium]
MTERAHESDIAELATVFSDLVRSSIRTRRLFLAKARYNLEWSSQLLISCVVNEGPVRASVVSEIMEADPSTVSRQVAQLVRDGYLERRADPDDGRASLLVPTERGLQLHREHLRVRNAHFARMLGEWDEGDLRRFSELLRRFTADYEKHRKTWFDEDAEPSRDAAQLASQRES